MTEDELMERIDILEANPLPTPRINWPVLLVMILACLATGLIAITLPFARNASNTSEDLARSTEITGCRSQANAEKEEARNGVDQIRVESDLLDNRWSEAISNGDAAAIEAIRPEFEPLRLRLMAAAKQLDDKSAAYQQAVYLSREDPDEFLRQCAEPVPPTTTTTVPRLSGIVGTTSTTAAPTTTPPRTTRRTTTTTTTRPTSTTGTTFPSSPMPTPTPTTSCEVFPPLTLPSVLPCPL